VSLARRKRALLVGRKKRKRGFWELCIAMMQKTVDEGRGLGTFFAPKGQIQRFGGVKGTC